MDANSIEVYGLLDSYMNSYIPTYHDLRRIHCMVPIPLDRASA